MAMLTKCFLNSIQGNNLMADQPIRAQDEKFCSSCGAVIKKEAEICPKCGVRQSFAGYSEDVSDKGADFLPKAVSCCVPLVGIVLYFVWKDLKPKASKDVCTWAIIGTLLSVFVYIIAAAAGAGSAMLG
jgi:ribosomal protein L40E